MRGRKLTAAFGAGCFIVACFILYRALDLMISEEGNNKVYSGIQVSSDEDVKLLENRMQKIEVELSANHKTIGDIKSALGEIVKANSYRLTRLNKLSEMYNRSRSIDGPKKMEKLRREVAKIDKQDCKLTMSLPPDPNIQMLDVYNRLKFDNPDGGVWKQGYQISYDVNQWHENRPLKVFVVPHSHNDPGWLKTVESYFTDQTKVILDNMVTKLGIDKRRKFIWAEISYLSMWWDTVDNKTKDIVKRYIDTGQLEIVTGGWVMTDEANAHYYAMLDQMIEGHQWLVNNLGVKPHNGWAIDPFGLSSTMAYLLQRSGLQNMVIQRVHYSIKKYFAQQKNLEFLWRQAWDHNGDTEMFCHMMPFYSYDVPHTCGPDPKICCQFDFKRLPGGHISCPWRVNPVPINNRNVHTKSETLLDQYRKKSQLYKTNVLLVELGDDFRFDTAVEWDQQYNNYQKLFDYMNSQPHWNVQAQFGTLSDYFTALHEESQGPTEDSLQFPSLSGDFFTYADRDDNYWSGYYTSRPFYKNLDRYFESRLRSTEIIFSLFRSMTSSLRAYKNTMFEPMMKKIVEARRTLGLFQHHDGITGTAKDHVVIDYAKKMVRACHDLDVILGQCVSHMLLGPDPDHLDYFTVDDVRESFNSDIKKRPIELYLVSQPKLVVLYNSLAYTRRELVGFVISSPYVEVTDYRGNAIQSQINPVWNWKTISTSEYQLYFIAEIPALGLSPYKIRLLSVNDDVNRVNEIASVSIYNDDVIVQRMFPLKNMMNTEGIVIENSFVKANINVHTGTLQSIVDLKNGATEMNSSVKFMVYGTSEKKDKSGAYLFLPGGDAKAFSYKNPYIRVVKGPLVSVVTSFIPDVEHSVILKNSPGVDGAGIGVRNIVDITSESNKELVMRIETGVRNSDEFFTDLNGFQVVKRRYFEKLPLQANVYPMPSLAYVEDGSSRFSVLSGQSLGVASLNSGWLEVFLDRRLMQDDNRGLGQDVTDNLRTPSSFTLLWERRENNFDGGSRRNDKLSRPSGFPSLTANNALQSLVHPPLTFVERTPVPIVKANDLQPFKSLSKDLPCNLHLLNLRTMAEGGGQHMQYVPKDKALLLIHNIGFDCEFSPANLGGCSSGGKIVLGDIFPKYLGEKLQKTTLSALHSVEGNMPLNEPVVTKPMQIHAYLIGQSDQR